MGMIRTVVIVFLFFAVGHMSSPVYAADYYVSPSGSDSNPGTITSPWRTVTKGITTIQDGDNLLIQSGTYDLQKLNTTLNKRISIIGEDKNTTILTNGDTIVLRQAITVSNLTFSGFYKDSYNDAVFRLDPGNGQTIDGLRIENCIFDNVPSVIWTNSLVVGDIRNVFIANNQFLNITSTWSVFPLRIDTAGTLSNITVRNNHFENIYSSDPIRDVIVVRIGHQDSAMPMTDVTVDYNTITRVRGGTQLTSSSYYPGGRGINVYANRIHITHNVITDFDQSNFPRNCIYIKGSNSAINYNILHNCGSSSGGGSGDLTIKGEANVGNVIKGNHVTSDAAHPDGGYAIFTKGGIQIEGNYVDREYGVALYSYEALGRQYEVLKNQLRASSWAARISQADTGLVADNLFVSLTESAVAYINSGLPTSNNILCYGSNCTQAPPIATCTNTGNYCTSTCSNPISAYNSTCDTNLCCPTYTPPQNMSPTRTPNPSTTIIPKPGDANGDGRVDGLDYVVWLNNYGRSDATGPSQGDFNADARVDGLDYVIWLNNYGT